MLVSIIAVTFNNNLEAINFLNSVRKLNFPKKELEIIIIDNGSKDQTSSIIKAKYPNANLIKLSKNRGAPYAFNLGFKNAKGTYILKCDSDVVLEKNCLEILLTYSQKIKDAAICGPKNYYIDKPNRIAPSAQKYNFWLGNTSSYNNLSQILYPDYLQGSVLFFPKKILRKVGYLDERYGLWLFDDQDFCLRAKRLGVDIIFYPKATIWHSTTQKTIDRPKVKLEQWYTNKIRFILKNANPVQILSSLLIQLILIPYYAVYYNDNTANSIVTGFIWNIKNINKTLLARKKQGHGITSG